MKKLIAIVGSLAILTVALWLMRSQPAEDAGTARSPERASSPAPPLAASESGAAQDLKPPKSVAPAPASEPARTTGVQPVPDSPPDLKRSQPTAAESTDEKQQLAECKAMWERQRTAEQVARAAETRDAGWADATEHKLHEYLSRRFKTIPIEVTSIDCRATYCEIKAQAFDAEAAHEFSTALSAVGDESWNDFAGSSFSHAEEAGKSIYHGEVRRKQHYATPFELHDDPRQLACFTLVGRQNQQQRAARDAEPRDPGWADQMEQLLRMYFTKELTRHPVERLEIICRTTFCQIKAEGMAQDGVLAVQKATNGLQSEPWANLRSGEGGSSGYGDRWTAEFTLIRQ
jgi:hypothetical protein